MTQGWEKLPLGRAGVVLLDCDHKTPEAVLNGRPYIGIPQMTSGRIDFSTGRQISEADFVIWTRKTKYQHNDVVLSRRTNPGVTAIDDTRTEFALGQNLVLLRANGKRVEPAFLRWLVRTPEWWEQIAKYTNVGAVFNSLRCRDVPHFELTIPPLPDQRIIAATLGALDDKIDLNRRMNETLEAMARALFRDWFVDFGPTRAKMAGTAPYLSDDLWSLFPGRLDADGKPEGWEVEAVIDQADWINGAAYKNMHFSEAPDALPVIKIAELKSGVTGNTQWTATDLGSRYLIDDGELLFSWSGNPDTSIDTFLWSGGKAWLNQHIFAVRENGRRSKPFLHAMLKFLKPDFAELARNKQTTGLGHVTKADMQRMLICTATQQIHQAFDRLITPIFDRAFSLQMESRTLAQTRDLLLPRLMSGELRLAEAEQLVEAAQ